MTKKRLNLIVTECFQCPYCYCEDGDMAQFCQHPNIPVDKEVFPRPFVWERDPGWIHEHCPLPDGE